MKKMIYSLNNIMKISMCILLFLTFCVHLQNIFISYIMGFVIDGLTTSDFALVTKILCFAVGITVVIVILSIFQKYLSDKLVLEYQISLRKKIYEHIYKVKLGDLKESTSTIAEKIQNDTNICANYFIIERMQAYIDFAMVLLISGMLLFMDKVLCASIVFLSIFNIGLYMLTYQRLFNVRKRKMDADTKVFQQECMWLSNRKMIKLESLYQYVANDLKGIYEFCNAALKKSITTSSVYQLICALFSSLSMLFIIYISMVRIQHQQISVGEFIIAFNFYSMLTTFLSSIMNFGSIKQKKNIAMMRLNDYMQLEREHTGNTQLQKIDCIQIKNLKISYEDNIILNHFDYEFKKGNTYLIQGANGIGKSSLLDALTAVIPCDFDSFTINTIPFKEIDLYSLREHIAYATQQLCFIDGSVTQNIYFHRTPKKEQLFRLSQLNNKDINENCISGGEKRKIVLNRAFTKNADVYLLDEPESFLDATARKEVANYIKSNKEKGIFIIISHSSDFKEIADHIINMT